MTCAQVEELETAKSQAKEEERYEECAELRDQISALRARMQKLEQPASGAPNTPVGAMAAADNAAPRKRHKVNETTVSSAAGDDSKEQETEGGSQTARRTPDPSPILTLAALSTATGEVRLQSFIEPELLSFVL